MPCLNLVLQQCRNEEQKRDLLVIFTFEETDFKSKTNPCFVYTVTFGQYIRSIIYILKSQPLIHKLVITNDTSFQNQI